jgi:hypothetical protein
MNGGSIGPVGDVGVVGGVDVAVVRRAGPGGERQGAERRVPGVQEFDRLEVNTATGLSQSYAKFTVHPESGMVSIKIIDARTDQVIREVPPEDVLKIVEELQAYLKLRTAKRG